jgi:hypothetical protein
LKLTASAPLSIHPIKQDLLKRFQLQIPPSTCATENNDIGNAIQVYFTLLSFSDEEALKCKQFFEKMGSRATPLNALYFCGLKSVMNNITAYINGTIVSFKDDEDSLSYRTISCIQNWLKDIQPKWKTSLAYDQNLLQILADQIKDTALADENKLRSRLHLELAVKYRTMKKESWRRLLRSFKVKNSADFEDFSLSDSDNGALHKFGEDKGMSLEQKVENFNVWFEAHSPRDCKIRAAVIPKYRIGTLAKVDITEEEVYLAVPSTIIMEADTFFHNHDLSALLQSLFGQFKFRDDEHELIFGLLYERFFLKSESKFWPYLQLLPSLEELDIPTLWSEDDVRLRLGPSFVLNTVTSYRQRILKSYDQMKNIKLISDFFDQYHITSDQYAWANAITDSRSIW